MNYFQIELTSKIKIKKKITVKLDKRIIIFSYNLNNQKKKIAFRDEFKGRNKFTTNKRKTCIYI